MSTPLELNRFIAGMSYRAELPTGIRATTSDRFAGLTYRQALTCLAQIVDAGFGTFALQNEEGQVRFRAWSSNAPVETELRHAESGRYWTANLPPSAAKNVILACPDLHAVFAAMQGAPDFCEGRR